MSETCALVGTRLGMAQEECAELRSAAALRDIGNAAIPSELLSKPGKLTRAERDVVETHTRIGHALLFQADDEALRLAATVALGHHERPDGNGYPRGVAREEIPLAARIASVADVFDALTNDRVYRPAYSTDEALALMAEGRGTQFDPVVLDAFGEVLDRVCVRPVEPDSAHGRIAGMERAPEQRPLSILIVEDDPVVRSGLELVLRREGMEVAGSAADLAGARGLLERRRPGVAIVDVDLADEDGVDLVEAAHQVGAKVLLYAPRADHEAIAAATASHALGIAAKAGSPDELLNGIRTVARGDDYRDPRLCGDETASTPRPRLSVREREMVTRLAEGYSGEQIAAMLFLSPQTIRSHIRNAMAKLEAHSRAHLIAVAIAHDEIALD